ncbi:hypothetical protein [Celerinatantimonas yamalensis]|uniref:YqjK-like protein n=1 Tax=Celerinatantimonas yamalensis TaxID=559956 RepID=A0ABW9G2N0_9GAMM
MKRQKLIKKIDTLDQKLNLRTENIRVLAQDTHRTFKKIPPVWLISVGAAAGALMATMGPKSFYAMGITGSRLFPLTSKAFSLGKQFGAGE